MILEIDTSESRPPPGFALLEHAAKRGNLRYAGEGIDRWVAGMDNEGAINTLADNLEILGRIHDKWGADQLQRNMQNQCCLFRFTMG